MSETADGNGFELAAESCLNCRMGWLHVLVDHHDVSHPYGRFFVGTPPLLPGCNLDEGSYSSIIICFRLYLFVRGSNSKMEPTAARPM
eukprot:4811913-Prymnesium_polylepis.1